MIFTIIGSGVYILLNVHRLVLNCNRFDESKFTFIPASIGESSANGISLADNSHSNTAKLHISAALTFIAFGLFAKASGAIH